MLTKQEKSTLRGQLFRYLDGLGTAPSAHRLHQHGITQHLLDTGSESLDSLTKKFKANKGYLNVALRILASQGWLDVQHNGKDGNPIYTTNNKSKAAFEHFWMYKDVCDPEVLAGMLSNGEFREGSFRKWTKAVESHKDNYGIQLSADELAKEIQQQILRHIEGILVAPTVVALGMSGMFHKYFMEHSFHPGEFHEKTDSFVVLLDYFVHLGWFVKKQDTYRFTQKGLFFSKRASAFGVTVSYIPTFQKLDELLFGNASVLRDIPEGSAELHVDRAMNVWGSGGAHATYFRKIDETIISLFNLPIHEQPKGIIDMGCGNGAYLQHLFEVIEQRTERGKMLDEYPLFLVGADFNRVALQVTRANLIKADIWAKVIWGDIGRPDLLAEELKELYEIEINDLLNVRTFLDHNRVWEDPQNSSASVKGVSTGAFAFRGRYLTNSEVEDNLVEHLKKWAPYIQKFGLLVIELHTIPPQVAAENIGKTAVTAYDATHGYSDQYIVEIEAFHKAAKAAGLTLVTGHFTKFPDNELATISINLFKGEAS